MYIPGFPRVLLRFEGLIVLVLSVYGYHDLGESWWLFALLFLVPDISMVGYVWGAWSGALVYNLGHNYVFPAFLALLGNMVGQPLLYSLALIWTAHIGFDRALGLGLKYPTGFSHTHLGRVGSGEPEEEVVGQ